MKKKDHSTILGSYFSYTFYAKFSGFFQSSIFYLDYLIQLSDNENSYLQKNITMECFVYTDHILKPTTFLTRDTSTWPGWRQEISAATRRAHQALAAARRKSVVALSCTTLLTGLPRVTITYLSTINTEYPIRNNEITTFSKIILPCT